ncbi:retrovirus-related pol polyprotein from transposon TNT 1-94 [Tanacetum coccineum]
MKNRQWSLGISKSSLEEEENSSDNPMMTRRTSERSRKTRKKIEGASSVAIQTTSLVIVQRIPSTIKRRLWWVVGVIAKMIKKKFVSWHTKTSLRIINKNKHLKAKNELLKRNYNELKIKLELLEKNKDISNKCDVCDKLEIEINSLKLKLASFENSSSSLQKMVEMQKPSKDKCGLGYTENIASSSNTKIKNLVSQIQKMPSVEPALPVPLTTEPASSDEQHRASVDSAENGKMLESNIIKKNDSVLITKKSILGTPKNSKQPPVLKLGQGHGKSRIQTPHKTTHRRPSTLYPKSDYHQVGWNYETQQEQLFRPPMYNQWSPYPPFPYMGQPNETMKVKESLNVKFDETPPPSSPPLIDDNLLQVDIIENQRKDLEVKENKPLNKQISNIKESKDHPLETVIGNLNQRTLRSQVQNQSNFFCFVSSIEPKNIKEAIQDESWTMAMQEELNKFKSNDVWCLVPPTKNQTVIGTKWVFKNKLDENGVVSRNKARLVAQGYN